MFEHASASSCLFQDDLDGLNALYPPASCATAVRELRCVDFSPNSGWKRLLILLVTPLVASLSPALLLALLLCCRRQRSPHAAKGIFETAAFLNPLARARQYRAYESLRRAKRTARVCDSSWDSSLGRSSRSDSSCISVSAVAADLADDTPSTPTVDISQFRSAPETPPVTRLVKMLLIDVPEELTSRRSSLRSSCGSLKSGYGYAALAHAADDAPVLAHGEILPPASDRHHCAGEGESSPGAGRHSPGASVSESLGSARSVKTRVVPPLVKIM
ncbi:hypothetical protein T492DRAFT_841727 [Pavlovales sp. CCMP2436]|nr:hypothetical protein T492DRAFT_841727 [Pavlovales sp. CCMP2436]